MKNNKTISLLLLVCLLTFIKSEVEDEKCKGRIVQCLVAPCSVDSGPRSECAKYLNATCVDNYCNGCNALYYKNGKQVCQKAGSVQCEPCAIRCVAGLQYDEVTGCFLCKCECPLRKCPAFPPCPYGRELDEYGCETCTCKKPACPPVCAIYCPYGNVLDANGCPTCKCKPCPDKVCGKCPKFNCKLKCPFGFVYDVSGCPNCECKKVCPPVCAIFCPNGNVLDANGCPTCKCKPKCPQVKCFKYCPNGYKVDQYGCQTCECNCPLLKCKEPICKPGFTNLDEEGCKTCGCRRICPQVKCSKYCPYGYKVDQYGCQTCQCNTGCPKVNCLTAKCAYGFLYENGCQTCKCKPCPPVTCRRYCEYGFKVDNKTGCSVCECNEKPAPVCNENSPYFKAKCHLKCNKYEKDEYGCPICICKEEPKCECKPVKYTKKKCYDGSYSNLTKTCLMNKNGNGCSFYEQKCPLCYSFTLKYKFDKDVEKIKDMFEKNGFSIPLSDIKVQGTTKTARIIVCIRYDAFNQDTTPQIFADVMKSSDQIEAAEFIADEVDDSKENGSHKFFAPILILILYLLNL